MRELVHDFTERGGTVLLSSHLLREVEAAADRLVVIAAGRIVRQGPVAELLSGGGKLVRAMDPAVLGDVLAAAGIDSTADPDGALRVAADPEEVGRAASGTRVVLTELRALADDLEQVLFQLTAGPPEESPAEPGATGEVSGR